MSSVLNDILSSQASTLGLAALLVIALMTGVITPGKAAQKRVDDANQRADDWAKLYAGSQAEGQVLRAQVIALSQTPYPGHTEHDPETMQR